MTFDKRWAEAGLGETGETILAGPDFLMRSDSRLFIEDRVPAACHRRGHPAGHPRYRDPGAERH